MLIKLPDGMWIDPKRVYGVYSDETQVGIDCGSESDFFIDPEDCKKFKSDKPVTIQELIDEIARCINQGVV